MTTKVTIEVPEKVDYTVKIVLLTNGTATEKWILPGNTDSFYIHNDSRVINISEIKKS